MRQGAVDCQRSGYGGGPVPVRVGRLAVPLLRASRARYFLRLRYALALSFLE
jgi:hypothetical protein